jgi:CheY-like chemotaxis protein
MTPHPQRDLLIVDDDPDLVRGLARLLRATGYPVRFATSGEEAISLAAQDPPAALIMDIMMPGTNGVEIYRQMKQRNPNLPVIFMTGYSDMEQTAREESGAAVLRKPVSLHDLLAELHKFNL